MTLNPDGSPQATVVWMALESTPDGDELVSAHLAEYRKTRNIGRDPRVAVTILSTDSPGQQTPYLAITGTARIVEGGAPELLKKLAKTMLGTDEHFPPPNSPPGLLTRIRIDKVGGFGPWAPDSQPAVDALGVCHHARRQGGDCDAAMSARVKSRTHRWFVLLFAALTVSGAVLATPATAIDTPIGRLGETLRVEFKGIVADVTVHDILPSDVPPGFGYPPRAPRYQVYRANVTIHAVKMPVPYAIGSVVRFQGRHTHGRRV